MEDLQFETSRDHEFNNNRYYGYVVTLGLIVIAFALLWVPSRSLRLGGNTFYWPFNRTFLHCLKCVPLPLAVAVTFFGFKQRKTRIQGWQFFMIIALAVLFLISLLSDYVLAWTATSVTHIDTVQFEENIYHLAKTDKFDERSVYYIGKCQESKYRCEFNEIFIASPNIRNGFRLERASEELHVMLGDDPVYTYDEIQGICKERGLVICSTRQP